jgi:hypothetical protein
MNPNLYHWSLGELRFGMTTDELTEEVSQILGHPEVG